MRTKSSVLRHRLRGRQLQNPQTVTTIRHVAKKAGVGHGDFHLMYVIEFSVSIVGLIKSQGFRLFDVDDCVPSFPLATYA